MQLAAYERDADALLTALVRARYLEGSGRWPALALTPAYERFPELSSLDAYEQLLDVETEERIAVGLQRLALELFVGAATAGYDQWLVQTERSLSVEWGGQVMPWRYARQLLGVEPERQPRHELDEAIWSASGPLARLRLDRLRASRVRIAEVGQ